jgi:hypothetical protein
LLVLVQVAKSTPIPAISWESPDFKINPNLVHAPVVPRLSNHKQGASAIHQKCTAVHPVEATGVMPRHVDVVRQ